MDRTTQETGKSGTVTALKDGMKKATTEMLVLFLLKHKPMYAYEMMQEVARLTAGALQFNTMYLAIYRLQQHGHICEACKETVNNRVRVYFAPTPAGLTYLEQLVAAYREMTTAITGLLAQDGQLYREEEPHEQP